MKITIYGGTGRAGSRICHEALSRGHQVTVVARNPAAMPSGLGVTVVAGDLSDVGRIAQQIQGAGAVISAYAPPPQDTDELVTVTRRLVEAVAQAAVPRLLVVGGAGSLNVAPGLTLIESGYLPAAWIPIAQSHAKTLELLRASAINWTYLSPAAYFEPGERTGHFRSALDDLLTAENGVSHVSMEDYAVAMMDEIEQPRHIRQRFSVGY